ncbi:hypothetical protein TSUD_124830 [Trifolium subterraneum]|uniref:RNase H type-1 domain-containing protein n=1 Tax=Trifolium subterraneum TaxID=3900 RepID=A0A2Z6M160_TRISU|nr:hypothetical protein TSUD_124830 [Trifolium subterraneum]
MVNTDGAKKGMHNYGCGGIIRDNGGNWICGFAKGLGVCSVELEAKVVVNMLKKEVGVPAEGWSLCKRIWRPLEHDWKVLICHIYRETNVCADMLAHVGCELGSTMMFYELCPTQIARFVIADAT